MVKTVQKKRLLDAQRRSSDCKSPHEFTKHLSIGKILMLFT